METNDNINSRLKALIPMLIRKGKIFNQEDLGNQLGYGNKSYVSQLINGRVNNSRFISDLLAFDKEINPEWLYKGIGDMFIKTESTPQSSMALLMNQISSLESENFALKNENKYLKEEIEEYKKNDAQNLDNFFQLLMLMNDKVDTNSSKIDDLTDLIKMQQSA